MIPYGRQDINQADIDAVVEVLSSDFLTQGPRVPEFETAVADYCGVQHAVAVSSATAALHVACLALGVSKGDIVWTSPITFVASANCALYCGAEVDFIDIDPTTHNMSVTALEKKLLYAEQEDRLPKVIIPVHFAGQSCDMSSIAELAQRYDFKIIEDASHAIGGKYKGEPIGNGQYSDITVFSFHPVKIITTGEGGMALTNNTDLAKKMALLSSHGITRNISDMTKEPDGPWYYEQIDLGFNYRMTDLQAALGLSQMQRLNEFVSRRHVIAQRYDDLLDGLPIEIPSHQVDSYSSLHLYVIRIQQEKINKSHREIFQALRDADIGVNLHYIPVYLQPYYKNLGFIKGHCPLAEKYYSESISLPIYPRLTSTDQDKVVHKIKSLVLQ